MAKPWEGEGLGTLTALPLTALPEIGPARRPTA
jgi:hypothetical protein